VKGIANNCRIIYIIIFKRYKNMERCPWPGNDDLYIRYHDDEWGVPVHDDRKHFEFLVLESAQAGIKLAHYIKAQGKL
jgi:hypothetical protein